MNSKLIHIVKIAALLIVITATSEGARVGFAQLNVPKHGGPASIDDTQAEVPSKSKPQGPITNTVQVTEKWLNDQNQTLLDSIKLLTSKVSPQEFVKFQNLEKTATAGKDASAVLAYRNAYLHEMVVRITSDKP